MNSSTKHPPALSRRSLIAGLGATAPLALLAGCGGSSGSPRPDSFA